MIAQDCKTYYREKVCETCPGSLWGEQSVCKVLGKHIGTVDSCPEWDLYKDKGAAYRTACCTSQVPVQMDLYQELEQDLNDYYWMGKEVERLRKALVKFGQGLPEPLDVYFANRTAKSFSTSHSGQREELRKWKQWTRLKNLEKKMCRIEKAADLVENEREQTTLEFIMEGKKMTETAKHLGISRQSCHDIKRKIIIKLSIFVDQQHNAND